jgi:hypothetical protein
MEKSPTDQIRLKRRAGEVHTSDGDGNPRVRLLPRTLSIALKLKQLESAGLLTQEIEDFVLGLAVQPGQQN